MQEADGAETKRDFIHKVSIAYKEARESRYWLSMIQASIMKDDPDVAVLQRETDEIVRILFTILNNARQAANRPPHAT
jgi:four helix bundle protein